MDRPGEWGSVYDDVLDESMRPAIWLFEAQPGEGLIHTG